jgi:hypothetical protein
MKILKKNTRKNILLVFISFIFFSSCKIYDKISFEKNSMMPTKFIISDKEKVNYDLELVSIDSHKIIGIKTPNNKTETKITDLKKIYGDTTCVFLKINSSVNENDILTPDLKSIYVYTESENYDLGKIALKKFMNGKIYVEANTEKYLLANPIFTSDSLKGTLVKLVTDKKGEIRQPKKSLEIFLEKPLTYEYDKKYSISHNDIYKYNVYFYNSRKSFFATVGIATLTTLFTILLGGGGNPGS